MCTAGLMTWSVPDCMPVVPQISGVNRGQNVHSRPAPMLAHESSDYLRTNR